MRPVSERQSVLQKPLSYMLGTEANVRLLRVLSETRTPLGKADVARRAGLNESGARRALTSLAKIGIVEALGTGSQRPVQLSRKHPLAPALESLFGAEAERFERLKESLQRAGDRVRPAPKSVWIQGLVARGSDRPGDPVIVGVLTTASQVERATEQLEALAVEPAKEHAITIEVRGGSTADLITADPTALAELQEVIVLAGLPPLSLVPAGSSKAGERTRRTHAALERRSLAFAQAIAEKLAKDPSIVDRAHGHITRRLAKASPGERKELLEWQRILETTPVIRLQDFLVDPGERATRLRQTLPFVGVLSSTERERILAEVSS